MASLRDASVERPRRQVSTPDTTLSADSVRVPPVSVVVRLPDGQITLRATRVSQSLIVDGRLDESVYEEVPSAGGFVQQEPLEGEAATERTDAWILFDDDDLYIAARCWDSQPGRMVANELRS